MNSILRIVPPDQAQRELALAPDHSVLVQAPAGSGKTDLLTRRFLRLLSRVDDPVQIVAITFTKAAAAEMRHRILSELEKAAHTQISVEADPASMEALAAAALMQSQQRGWNLIELPSQLRISTIDSFCREIALQQPLLSGLGGALDIAEQPEELYRRAARGTLQALGAEARANHAELQQAIETLLLWRDNNWRDLEDQLMEMLAKRDRWMQEFVLGGEQDWDALRARLENPFAKDIARALVHLNQLLSAAPGAREEAHFLARFACSQKDDESYRALAELTEFPSASCENPDAAETARLAWLDLAQLLLTNDGTFRKTVNVGNGFPADRKREKQRHADLITALKAVPGLESALHSLRALPPARYAEEDWTILRACFTLLRHAAAELRVVFAEAGAADYIEVAQMAQRVLQHSDGTPTDAALVIADEIHHLLVDEFQDTSRRQHRLIASLVAAWPDVINRTVFVVGDPMQSIYFFRDADAELFARVRRQGLELPGGDPLPFTSVRLASNFRAAPELVKKLNDFFSKVFAADDGSGIQFAEAEPARAPAPSDGSRLECHIAFLPQTVRGGSESNAYRQEARDAQIQEIVALIQNRTARMEAARIRGEKYRIAVLGRTGKILAPIAEALREASIPFRAVDLEPLGARPEVLDALALGRALLNGEDRVAWLGVLRAPWCGLSLADLHILASADDPALNRRPIPQLLAERAHLLSEEGQHAVARLQNALAQAPILRVSASSSALGTWIQQVWLLTGGADCVDEHAHTNLDLLWNALDHLPDSEPGLLSSALDAALKDLTAQPDPAAGNENGVHLMTIHKSKGLEFEVVLVPDLHAQGRLTHQRMIAWLERGLAEQDESGAVTEFLVAPQQSKGADPGKSKAWVEQVYRTREQQEMRRILYVAATRAREELHFFTRIPYQESRDEPLAPPARSLLATAWPALSTEAQAQYTATRNEQTRTKISDIAASGEIPPILFLPEKPALLRRLPADYEPPALACAASRSTIGGLSEQSLYARHEGGLLSRALGTAVHAFFAEMARLSAALDPEAAHNIIHGIMPQVAAQVRAGGVERTQAETIAAQAWEIAQKAFGDPVAQWILAPHAEAAAEARWTGVIDGALRNVQADRIFRAGNEPMTKGENTWWIVDYKTTHAEDSDPKAALPRLRSLFAPQLELYARVLRLMYGADAQVRTGLYYPRMMLLDWWEI